MFAQLSIYFLIAQSKQSTKTTQTHRASVFEVPFCADGAAVIPMKELNVQLRHGCTASLWCLLRPEKQVGLQTRKTFD